MTCDELADAYELYALGVLEGPEREALEEHLGRNCETCMKEINRAVEHNALVFRAVPKLDPPAGLRSRILAGFGLETRPFWERALPWGVAAAAVVVLFMTIGYSMRRTPADATASAIEFLSAPGTRQVSFGNTGPHGSVLMHQDKGMLLVVVNLPAAPAGKMYETWLVPPQGAPKPIGQLESASNGDAIGRIPGPFNMATVQAVAVSLEPAGSKPVTPTQVIFAAPLSGS
jgi:anti-sigma-K factor RskA